MTRWADRDVVVVAPEADFVAGFDPELVAEFLRNDDLALGSDTVSHTDQYNSTRRRHMPAQNARSGIAQSETGRATSIRVSCRTSICASHSASNVSSDTKAA